MNKTEIKEIVKKVLSITEIEDSADLREMGMESVQLVGLIVELENKYDIEILDSDLLIDKFSSIDVIFDTLQKYCKDSTPLYKCIITDCDGVLWRKIAGEAGEEAAYSDTETREFCETLAGLKKRGVLLAGCTRNEKKNIENMLNAASICLGVSDFSMLEYNCADKVSAVRNILAETGFYPDNVLYIDDSDQELEILSTAIPELKCIKAYGQDDFIEALASLFYNLPETTDIDRTTQFHLQKEREKVHIETMSAEEYNHILETNFYCGIADRTDAARLAELSQRANRFNITDTRYTVEDITERIDNPGYMVYYVKVSDKFGDMGTVAMAVVCGNGEIESFILSCRVFGRNFESLLLQKIQEMTAAELRGVYVSTGKNDYCRDFYKEHGVNYETR